MSVLLKTEIRKRSPLRTSTYISTAALKKKYGLTEQQDNHSDQHRISHITIRTTNYQLIDRVPRGRSSTPALLRKQPDRTSAKPNAQSNRESPFSRSLDLEESNSKRSKGVITIKLTGNKRTANSHLKTSLMLYLSSSLVILT